MSTMNIKANTDLSANKRDRALRETIKAFLVLALIIPLVNIALVGLREHFNLTTNTLFLLVLTVGISIKSPLWLSIASAIENFLFLNFLFTPPFHTFAIGDKNDLISLLSFIFFSVIASVILNQLKIRTRRLQQMSEEGSFLSHLASDIIRGHNSTEDILENSKVTFGISGIAVVSKIASIPQDEIRVIYGSIDGITSDLVSKGIKLNSRYSLITEPPIVDVGLRDLLTTFGTQILVLLERQILEENERELSDIKQTDQMRSALLTAVSHDLRGPLASTKAAISSLLNTEVDWSENDRRELLQTANHSLDQLNNLIENLLDMSRLEGNAISLQWRSVDVEDAISGAVKALKSNRFQVVIRVEDSLPTIGVDPILLERVLVNLIENALRFNPKDQAVEIEASRAGKSVLIRVIDHGPGIEPRNRGKIFVPFQRLGDRDNTTGVGLGLAIVKGFTELMNGTVSVDETPLGGLTMVLTFDTVEWISSEIEE